MGVGGVVGVMGSSTSSELMVTDLCGNHEPLHDHDVHGPEVPGNVLDTVGHVLLAPGLLQEEDGLGLEDGGDDDDDDDEDDGDDDYDYDGADHADHEEDEDGDEDKDEDEDKDGDEDADEEKYEDDDDCDDYKDED